MTEYYRQGDEFKTGVLSTATKRMQLEGKRQGRSSYGSAHEDSDRTGAGKGSQRDDFQLLSETVEAQNLEIRLAAARNAAEQALREARIREQDAREALEDIRSRATKTADGTAVYLSADGTRAFDEHGNELSPEALAEIDWRDGAPTWEERQETGKRFEEAAREREEIEDYRDRLDSAQDKLGSAELSQDELDGMRATLDSMPASVTGHLGNRPPPRITAATLYEAGQGIEAESLSPAFRSAHDHNRPEMPQPAHSPAITLDR